MQAINYHQIISLDEFEAKMAKNCLKTAGSISRAGSGFRVES